MAGTDLGWTSQIGGVYHKDAENMVTRQTPPQLNHCIEKTVIELVELHKQGRLDGVTRGDLWRILHYYKKRAAKRMVRDGSLKVRHLRGFKWPAEPGYVTLLGLAALLPGWFVRLSTRLYRTVKRWRLQWGDGT
jgi:hypothetical protein